MRTAVRLVGRVLGLTALAVALTGCLKLSQDLTLNPDDTVDGEITLAVSKELLELSGQSEEDAISSITEGDTPLPEGIDFETEPYDDGEFVGQTFVFSGAPLDRFSGEGSDELGIAREGDTFVVSGNLDLSQGSEGIDPNDPTTQQLLESFDVQISVTFPGAVETANGEIDGNTVTWRPQFGENLEISAVGSAIDNGGGGGAGGALLWILIGAAVVLVVVLVVVLLARRGKGSGGAEAAPAGIGFSPPGEAAAAAGAIGAPPAPVQPPATPLPVETQHTPAPPIPTDTAGSLPTETAPEPVATAPEPVEAAPEPPPSDSGSSDVGGDDASSSGADGGDGSTAD